MDDSNMVATLPICCVPTGIFLLGPSNRTRTIGANDCGGVGAGIYIAAGIGALVGGFVGWVVYEATR